MAIQSGWLYNVDDTQPLDGVTFPHSFKVTYPSAATVEDILDTVDSELVNHGWSLWDDIGTNDKVYRAINVDATTYKYLRLNLTGNHFKPYVYEDWNNVTHAGTNQCLNYNDNYWPKYDLTNGGFMVVFATNRYAFFWSSSPSQPLTYYPHGPIGIVEFTRNYVEDTAGAGLPPFGWWNTYAATSGGGVTIPRSPLGTGSYATMNRWGTVLWTNNGGVALMPTVVEPWNSKNWALPVRFGCTYGGYAFNRGYAYGSKIITQGIGTGMDELDIKCDVNFMPDEAGTILRHRIVDYSTTILAIPQ